MHNARTSFTMRVSFHCKALSMRRIYGVGEISKIIPTSIVVSTVVPLANTVSAAERRCCQQTTGRKRLSQPFASVPVRIDDLSSFLIRRGPWLVTDFGAEDLWHIGNTRRPQFTAHYLVRLFTSHFPPPALSTVVSFLRLEPFTLCFFFLPDRIYRQSRDFPCLYSFVFLFVAFSNSNFAIPFISLYFYSYIFPFLPFSLFSVVLFLAFYDFLFFFSYSIFFNLFFSFPLRSCVLSFSSPFSLLIFVIIFAPFFILILFFCF